MGSGCRYVSELCDRTMADLGRFGFQPGELLSFHAAGVSIAGMNN